MGFPAKASFRISEQPLDFAKAHKLYKEPGYWHRNYTGANISDKRPDQSHYWIKHGCERNPTTNEREECYHLLMYATNIHTWWEDGTYQSRYHDSWITRDVLSAFGPVRVWRDPRVSYQCITRFGLRGRDYPYEGGIVVDPEGWVRELVDRKEVMVKGATKKRTLIRKQFRENTLSRILLGEFPAHHFAREKSNVKRPFGQRLDGWFAMLPPLNSGIESAFFNKDRHEVIRDKLERWPEACWETGPCRDNQIAAVAASVEGMADQLLFTIGGWYENELLKYPPVNVRDLR